MDVERLAHVKGFIYNVAVYRCAYLKDQTMKAKVSIFRTGKMISIGAKTFKDAKHDLNRTAKRLLQLQLILPVNIQPNLQNIVAIGDIGQPINIESLSSQLPKVIYEPEQFPGAIYYAKELEGASILIFRNGKVVIAGLKRMELCQVASRVLMRLAELAKDA